MNSNDKNHVSQLINRLEMASVLLQCPNSFESKLAVSLDRREVNTLAGYSSILSLSSDAEDTSLSYEIITRLLEYTKGSDESVIAAADVVFSRIGNFPGRTLLRNRYFAEHDISPSSALKLECVAREAENTIFTGPGNGILLTDFQYKFLDSLNEESALSISAPTSAGKSFVLNIDLVKKIKQLSGQSIVYVVPTRALISEVSYRIRATLRDEGLNEVVVRTAPFPVHKDKIKLAAVYVFTQERLMSYINSQEGEPRITSLIIDEAHEIQNGKRGIVLQNAIDIALSRFGPLKVLFASPLIRNPSYFLSLFGQTSNGKFFVETVSPVSQNIILVNQVKRKPSELDISLLNKSGVVSIGCLKAGFRLREGAAVQRANFALAISEKGESVISFSNGPADAETVAGHIARFVSDFEPSEEVIAFSDFIRKEVHSEYGLADCVLKGVAFHYGKMPSLVRTGIEGLFKDGHLKIICCTSTLLQGVNLPAKHIVIENPMSGDDPMTRADFLNLAGRAGRLLKEFHGNIWCIRPGDWKSDCYKGEALQEISSAINNVMEDGGTIVQALLDSSERDNDMAEAAFGKLYHDYLIDRDLDFIEKYRTENNSAVLDKTVGALKGVNVTLPLSIIENNQSLRPDHLENLYTCLKVDDLSEDLPMSPYIEGAKGRMESIFKTIKVCFEWDISDTYMSWVALLAHQWVWGDSIGKILTDRVNYKRRVGSTDNTSVIIRGCLGVLESTIRFKLVKYFSAYIDVLRFVALEKGLVDQDYIIEPFHIYLEFGTCNRHALNLMALGISRFTALHLENKFDLPDDVEPEEYLDLMSKMNIEYLRIPTICLNEIKDLVGPRD